MKTNWKFSPAALWGAVLGILALGICWIWYSPAVGALFAGLFLAAGFLRLPGKHPLLALAVNGLWGIGCIVLSALTPTLLYGESRFFDLYWYIILMNLLCVAVVYGLALAVTGRIKWAVGIASFILLVGSTANYFVCQFRGHEMTPMDLTYMRTAATVIGGYVFTVPPAMAYSWLAWLWSVFALGALPTEEKIQPKLWIRLGALAAAGLCLLGFWKGAAGVKPYNWEKEGTLYNGYYLNFFAEIRDSVIKKPEGYAPEEVAALEEAYAGEWDLPGKPDIVVVMVESFADLGVLGSPVRTNQPVTPFLDSLEENTIRGYALCSVFGGATANSEFEFLTGQSMAFLPQGAVPYSQYIRREVYSLPWLLRSLGYQSDSTHPFSSTGYNRQRVYPMLGFESSTFIEAYPDPKLVRRFVSDQEAFDYILRQLENKGEDPLFLFSITMQNHSGYTYEGDNYEKTISLEGYAGDYPQAEQYLSLIRETDRAAEGFFKALESREQDTIVLFFGDHLPGLEEEFYQELHGGPFDSLEEKARRYMVPFYIWANFDIPEQQVPCTSLSYLSRYLLEAAGGELPPYYRFLKDLEQVIPAQNAFGYFSREQGAFLPIGEARGEEAQWLQKYGWLQYNSLFDKKGQSGLFFKKYLP